MYLNIFVRTRDLVFSYFKNCLCRLRTYSRTYMILKDLHTTFKMDYLMIWENLWMLVVDMGLAHVYWAWPMSGPNCDEVIVWENPLLV